MAESDEVFQELRGTTVSYREPDGDSPDGGVIWRFETQPTAGAWAYLAPHAQKYAVLSATAQANSPALLERSLAVDGLALRCASSAQQGDVSWVRKALAQNGLALEFASPRLRGNAAVVLAAVAQDATALVFASEALQDNPEIVLAAVRQRGTSILIARYSLRDRDDIARTAVTQDGLALAHLHIRKAQHAIPGFQKTGHLCLSLDRTYASLATQITVPALHPSSLGLKRNLFPACSHHKSRPSNEKHVHRLLCASYDFHRLRCRDAGGLGNERDRDGNGRWSRRTHAGRLAW